jgi:putative oxidoreductase
MHHGWLVIAGFLSLGVALFHVVGAFIPRLAKYFGAPERLLSAGRVAFALVTLLIAAVFALWGLYGLSGAGWLTPLPLLRPALVIIGAIYLFRGALILPQLLAVTNLVALKVPTERQHILSSAASLTIGIAYLVGIIVD